MTREIETFTDTPLRNKVEAFELLERILKPFNITLDDDLLLDGGERTYTYKNATCGTLRIHVLCVSGELPALAVTAEERQTVMVMAMNHHHVMMQPGKARQQNVVPLGLIRIFRELVEWVRTAVREHFEQRYAPA